MRLSSSLKILPFIILVLMVIVSCVNPPNYPDTPVIKYEGVNKTSVYQAISSVPDDTLELFISFTDGDGDLSFEDSTDIFLINSKFPSITSSFSIPSIPEEGTGNGIRGEITIRILNKNNNICCISDGIACNPNSSIATDTFSYTVQIRDRAGHRSNIVRTELITVLCQ